MIIYGINPVIEAIRAGRVDAIRFAHRGDARLSDLLEAARKAGVTVKRVDADELERASHGGVHQGVVALLRDPEATSVEDLVALASGAPLLVVLDGVEDPHNVGAILRSVDAAGGHGVVRQIRHAAPLGGAAAKASAGAVAHVKVADVVNIARALEALKDAGVWTVGLAGDASKSVRRDRFHAADGDRGRRRGDGSAASGARAMRLAGVGTDEGARSKLERVGRDRRRVVRGRAAAP